jgi:hypothetical protein
MPGQSTAVKVEYYSMALTKIETLTRLRRLGKCYASVNYAGRHRESNAGDKFQMHTFGNRPYVFGFILSNKFFHCDLMLSWYASPVFIWIRMPVILWKFIMHRENGVVVCT